MMKIVGMAGTVEKLHESVGITTIRVSYKASTFCYLMKHDTLPFLSSFTFLIQLLPLHSFVMFVIKDSPVENHRRLKIRIIGAGYSGIYLGIRIPQRLRNVDLRIYEKEDQTGGKWWVNKYPGGYL